MIREEIRRIADGVDVAIVISDTFGRAWRDGHANIAIGVAGMNPVKDYRGTLDVNGMVLKVTTIAAADELAAAAELVTAKAIQVPVALIRGYDYEPMEERFTIATTNSVSAQRTCSDSVAPVAAAPTITIVPVGTLNRPFLHPPSRVPEHVLVPTARQQTPRACAG